MSKRAEEPSGFGRLLAEMKRRHVVRFALGYAAAAFVVLQLAEIVLPAFDVGEAGIRIAVVAVALLFPPAVVLAWVFDITSEGIKRTEELPDGGRGRGAGGLAPRVALLVLTSVVVGSLGVWLARQGVLEEPERPTRRAPAPQPALVAYDPGQPIRSLAVLPLSDFSDGGSRDYFTAGMQEELIAQLSQIGGLRVVSRTSVQRYARADVPVPTIGRELQVDAVIEGSVRRSADRVRITVQLIHAASDTHVWTQQYDRRMDDVLALQSEVALDIARQIQAELSPQEATALRTVASRSVDPEAQDAYLRGRYEVEKGTPAGYESAMHLFARAVDADSTFAPALAGLAATRALVVLEDTAGWGADLDRARRDALRALDLDSTSVEAREVLALIGEGVPPPPPAPDSGWVTVVTQLGRHIEERMRGLAVGPAHDASLPRLLAARQLTANGRFADAARVLSDLVDDAPDNGAAWELLARTRITSGDAQGAVGAMEGWSARGGADAPTPADVRALQDAVTRDGALGYWRWSLARLEARRAAGERVSPTEHAAALAATGDTEGAFEALSRALAERERGLPTIQNDPAFDPLRGDPRFADVVRRARAFRFGPERPPSGPERRR